MDLTQNEKLDTNNETVELFKESINKYLAQFLDARKTLDEEKKSWKTVSLERLLEIFSDYNNSKRDIIESFFLFDDNTRNIIKDIELTKLFSESEWPIKSAIGEIKAWIENILITNIS